MRQKLLHILKRPLITQNTQNKYVCLALVDMFQQFSKNIIIGCYLDGKQKNIVYDDNFVFKGTLILFYQA